MQTMNQPSAIYVTIDERALLQERLSLLSPSVQFAQAGVNTSPRVFKDYILSSEVYRLGHLSR
ncbi:MAG: hypothetical protein SFZ03_06565 [Candidatus Melainabacteria bacterium]|nr:hypothetical protein [Candidatus Melainabacteria bacterium]